MNRNGNSLQGLVLRHVALALFGVVATVCSEDPAVAAPTPEEGPALATRTGQFNGDGQIWNGSFDLAGPSGDEQAAPTSVPAPDAATTSTPAAKNSRIAPERAGGIRRLHLI